jgi:DNA polymerase-3 subunit chi
MPLPTTAPAVSTGAPAIDFHFNVDHCVGYACRVVRKARSAGRTVLVYSRDEQRLARVDLALWTFSALDFLPHVGLPSPLAGQTPVWLSSTQAEGTRDILLLLEDEPVRDFDRWFPRFARVIDVVSCDTNDRALARVRFKTYRDAGFATRSHEIGPA